MKEFKITRKYQCTDEQFEFAKEKIEIKDMCYEVNCHGIKCSDCPLNESISRKKPKSQEYEIHDVKEIIVLTEEERKKLEACLLLGFEWLTRDVNGIVYGFTGKPIKSSDGYWYCNYPQGTYVYSQMPAFKALKLLSLEDEEPTEIRRLLG